MMGQATVCWLIILDSHAFIGKTLFKIAVLFFTSLYSTGGIFGDTIAYYYSHMHEA